LPTAQQESYSRTKKSPAKRDVEASGERRPAERRSLGSPLTRTATNGNCWISQTCGRNPEILDESNPPFYKWFADGKLNASYNCLDRHVEAGDGDRIALHWRGEGGEERDLTYSDFHRDVLGESASRARDAACRQRFEQ